MFLKPLLTSLDLSNYFFEINLEMGWLKDFLMCTLHCSLGSYRDCHTLLIIKFGFPLLSLTWDINLFHLFKSNRCSDISLVFLFYFLYLFLERGGGSGKEGERNINVWLSLTHPQLGTQSATQACALTGN